MNEQAQVSLLGEQIKRLTEQLEKVTERLEKILDPEFGLYAKGAALESRISNVERDIRYGKWLISALVLQAIAYFKEVIARLFN